MKPSLYHYHFSVAFPDIPDPVADLWLMISSFLVSGGCMPKQFEVSQIAGHHEEIRSEQYLKLTAEEVGELIVNRGLDGFSVSSGRSPGNLGFYLLNAKNLGPQSCIGCVIEQGAKAPKDWRKLIETIIFSFPSIGGWQWQERYQSWQRRNRKDAFYERSFGVVPPGFRTWSEPGPLALSPQPEKIFLDISSNPGRSKELAFRINFYPTAEMWLGPHFWQYAKCTKEEALAADFWIEKRETPHYVYLKCWPEAFTRPDGEQGRMQQRLWKLFFHEDCEWPPGSGTICDEPMYGPPELMPGYKSGSTPG